MGADWRPRTTATRVHAGTLRRAAVAATLAHSHDDAEPWRLELGSEVLELYADAERWRLVEDPTGRALTISVGCALLNARAVLAFEEVEHEVVRLPDPDRPHLLATLVVGGPRPSGLDQERLHSGLARLADRSFVRASVDPLAERHPRPAEVTRLAEAAREEGADLRGLGSDRVVLATPGNRLLDWVVAGEAAQRVLLEAAELGLGAEEDDAALAAPGSQPLLRDRLALSEHPQVVLRLGAPGRIVRGRRRPLADVLRAGAEIAVRY